MKRLCVHNAKQDIIKKMILDEEIYDLYRLANSEGDTLGLFNFEVKQILKEYNSE